jgi:nicotinamide mononucleotide transporter
MNEFTQNITAAFLAQSWLEVVAVITAILYLVLAVKENKWCWLFGFITTAIYVYLFYHVALFSESLLNFYYLIMAIYGWVQWNKKGQLNQVRITKLPYSTHIKILFASAVLTPIIGGVMQKLGASFPYVDAFVAIIAVAATWMTAKKIFENWHYWLVVDVISIYLFWQKELYLTALLFVVYIVLIFVGIKHWKKLMSSY